MKNLKTFNFQNIPQPQSSFWIINDLSALEHPVKRIFFNKSEEDEIRGDHAHHQCWQTLVCLDGIIEVTLDDGQEKLHFSLNKKGLALTIPPKIWGTQEYEANSYLMVLCSHEYSERDYIKDYDVFLEEVRN
tara:strand:+ start:6844 stop:7239 length:396 start_codon:yes stop_codon:yes gene_type:complete